MEDTLEHNDMLKGIIVGSCLGGLTALLLAPMSGKALRQEFTDCCNAVNEQTKEYYDELTEQGHKIKEQACKYAGWQEEHNDNSSMLLGGLFGSIVAAVAVLLLAPQNSKDLRKQLGKKYEEIRTKAEEMAEDFPHQAGQKAEEWKNIFSSLVDNLTTSKMARKASGKGKEAIDDIADWAMLGLKVFNALKK